MSDAARASCPKCFIPLVVYWDRAAPANPVAQELYGCSVDHLVRFFGPEEWLQKFDLPVCLTWGTAEEWRQIAEMWRSTRATRSGFPSFEEINAGWSEKTP